MLFDQLATFAALFQQWVGDVATAWAVVLVCGLVVSTALGFAWLHLLTHCVRYFVWLTVLLVFFLLLVMDLCCFFKAGQSSFCKTRVYE